ILDDQRGQTREDRLHKLVDIHHANVNDLSRRSVTTECETGPLAGQTHSWLFESRDHQVLSEVLNNCCSIS
ncbi:hypothetical protein ACWC2T_45710, partial [Streptomyces sp. NPDC001393]